MVWANGGEGSRIPKVVVRLVRQRDHDRCQLAYDGCTGWYQQIDHKHSLASRGMARTDPRAHETDGLQCVCDHCHNIKTQREAHEGRMRGRTMGKLEPERPLWLRPAQ